MYKSPASGFLDVALSATSFDDLVSRMRLWDDVFRQGAVAVSAVEHSRAEVQQRGVRLAGDRRQAVTLLAQVAVQRTEIAAEVRRGQSLLAAAQVKVKTLVKQAKARGGGGPGRRRGGATGRGRRRLPAGHRRRAEPTRR